MDIKEIVTLLCEAREALDELTFETLPDSLRAIAAKLDQALDATLILEKQQVAQAATTAKHAQVMLKNIGSRPMLVIDGIPLSQQQHVALLMMSVGPCRIVSFPRDGCTEVACTTISVLRRRNLATIEKRDGKRYGVLTAAGIALVTTLPRWPKHTKETHQATRKKRTAAYRPAPPITISAPSHNHDAQPLIAFLEVHEPLGDNTYRLGHLPTADEQIMDRDDSE